MRPGSPDSDRRWMRRALELAARGRYGVSPNPMVGAVVVGRSGRKIGEGFHAEFGGSHAEVIALREAGADARGASLYVTLEPCNHHGKTPPCVDAILSAGVERVVVAMREPNPDAAGGLDRLRAEGVETAVGGDTENARVLNRRWLKWAQERRPWVTLKAAISMDGRIATRTGQSKWITGEAARHRSLELREEHDAILVGVETILADNPRLTRRLDMNPRGPWKRVILDSRLRTPSSAAAVQSDPDQTLIAHTAAADPGALAKLEEAGAQLLEVVADDSGLVDLHQLLEHLARRGIAALLVEGGARVHGSFVDSELVDEAVFFVAPLLIGGNAPSAVAGRGIADLDLASKFVFEHIDRHGEDLEVRAVRPGGAGVHRVD